MFDDTTQEQLNVFNKLIDIAKKYDINSFIILGLKKVKDYIKKLK